MIKTRKNWKLKVPCTVLERLTLRFSLYKNCKWRLKLWWIGARGRKKMAFLYCFISMCWISFQNIYTFTYQKQHYLKHCCCLFLNSSETFSLSLSSTRYYPWQFLIDILLLFSRLLLRSSAVIMIFRVNKAFPKFWYMRVKVEIAYLATCNSKIFIWSSFSNAVLLPFPAPDKRFPILLKMYRMLLSF